MLVTQFDKFVNRSTQEILGSEIEQENLEPMLSTDIVRNGGNVTGVKGENEVYYRTGNVNLTSTDIGALNEDNVYNGLDQTDPGYALDARQGKALADDVAGKLDKSNVYNGLDKTASGYALDARQGKALADEVGALNASLTKYVDVTKNVSNSVSNKYYIVFISPIELQTLINGGTPIAVTILDWSTLPHNVMNAVFLNEGVALLFVAGATFSGQVSVRIVYI